MDAFEASNGTTPPQKRLKTIKKYLEKISPTSVIAMETFRKSQRKFVLMKVKSGQGLSN
jgi:hypothetical protein